MSNKRKQVILLIILILILLTINYPFLDKKLEEFLREGKYAKVTRVIDGDTIEIDNNESVRLLGINTPERGEPYFEQATEFLESLILNETVRLEFGKEEKDKYGRTLGYVFLNDENVNLEIIERGFANFYFPSGKDVYYSNFKEAWEECLEENINLCEKSDDECAGCISLKEFDYENEIVVFYNKCNFDCELTRWSIKHEGRKKFIFPDSILREGKEINIIVREGKNNETSLFWNEEDVFIETGDSLFLRDDEGKLVFWKSY